MWKPVLSLICLSSAAFLAAPDEARCQLDNRRAPGKGSTRTADEILKVKETIVRFELLRYRNTNPLDAQRWGQVFQKLNVSLRVRNPILDDKPEIEESMLGRIREVKAIGSLAPDGSIVFPDHKFTFTTTGRLKEWVDELKTYGAQGAPEGKPAFGLNKKQFAAVMAALSRPVANRMAGVTLDEALKKLELPRDFPIRLTRDTEDWLKKSGGIKLRNETQGFSKGTALALALSEYGLGFRPLRTPSGAIEFAISPIEKQQDRWPIGWDPEEMGLKRPKVAPKLFKIVPVDLKDVPLKEVLDGISVATETPIVIDYQAAAAKRIDVDNLKVSHPAAKRPWSLILKGITNPHKLTRVIRVDERNRGFVIVTPIVPKPRKR